MAFDSKVDRMHVPKLIALEEVGWYRENSLRFYKLFRPKPLLSGFVSMVLIPVFIEAEHRNKGEEVTYLRNPFGRIFDKHRAANGGNAADYVGPEEALKYTKQA